MSEPVKEALKEFLRLVVFAIIPVLIVVLTEVGAEWGLLMVGALRFIDKFLHEYWKEKEVNIKGLLPF